MAAKNYPGSISLHGSASTDNLKTGFSSAILLKLDDNIFKDVRKASQEKDRLQFVSGATPKLRIGTKLIDLTLSADEFRNELFASTSPDNLTFTSVLSHRAEVKTDKSKASEDTDGPDAALAALQSSLASLKQEKEAKQANITNTLIPAPKNRYEAARKEKMVNRATRPGLNGSSRPSSPPIGAVSSPHLGAAPTSAPANEEDLKLKAMRTPVLHLLAIEPLRREQIIDRTHIPKADLDTILQRIGKQGEAGKWQLSDKAYRDLDVWKFKYSSEQQRKKATDNAIRAYDRMRIHKDEQQWQMLLPKEERGKGKTLSRLHLGGGQVNRGLTPSYQPSPAPHGDDSRVASAANTPKMGPSTPRPGSSTGDVRKRLLAKDPQKARAAEDAKEKKRKEREAASSDRESAKPAKKQATKKSNVKSEEIVHSSDDESDGESVKKSHGQQSKSSPEKTKTASKVKSKAIVSSSSDSSDTALKDKADAKPTAKPKPAARATDSPNGKPQKATTAGKSTPQTTNNLAAPSSQQRSQRSPSNPGNRPNVPSPLGAARPRVASDVSDRGAVGVQKVRQGAETPKGLGITNGVKKQTDSSDKMSQKNGDAKAPEKQQKSTANGAETPKSLSNGASHKTEELLKRKAEKDQHILGSGSAPKHRKTDSTSSNKTANGMGPSPNGPFDTGSSDDTADSVLDTITYNQGVKLAKNFQTYYVAYDQEYEAQKATEAKGETVSPEDRRKLLDMHNRLAQMKREIQAASEREHA